MSADSQLDLDADQLIAEGRRLEAIDVLMDENRRQRDAAIEQKLVAVRHEAYEDLVQISRQAEWPPNYDDPFDGREGLIEVDVRDLDTALIGGALQHHSCLLVRGLLDERAVDELTDDMDHAIEQHTEWQAK